LYNKVLAIASTKPRFQLLSLQVDAGAVEPSLAAFTTQLKRLGNI